VHLYLSHPQVVIDPDVPVPSWNLSPLGRERTLAFARAPWLNRFHRIVSSGETKAIETATIIADVLGLNVEIDEAMHENDRSATGFLPPAEFEAVADQFFAHPERSVRGWETANAAQARIVAAVGSRLRATRISKIEDVPTMFVGHGGVGTLLLCHIAGSPVRRSEDQPAGGGNHFAFTLEPARLIWRWKRVEAPVESGP